MNKRISQLSAINSALQTPGNRGYSSYNKYDHKRGSKHIIDVSKKFPSPSQKLCTREQGLQQAQHQLQETKLDVRGCYRTGTIQNCLESLKKIASGRAIIDIVRNGLKIDFEGKPINDYVPIISYKSEEIEIISEGIAKLLQKGVIIECEREEGYFLSALFTRKKKDGNMRTTLNLKCLRKHVTCNHFKMESLQDVFKIIQPKCKCRFKRCILQSAYTQRPSTISKNLKF